MSRTALAKREARLLEKKKKKHQKKGKKEEPALAEREARLLKERRRRNFKRNKRKKNRHSPSGKHDCWPGSRPSPLARSPDGHGCIEPLK